jgi:hypothetical protein
MRRDDHLTAQTNAFKRPKRHAKSAFLPKTDNFAAYFLGVTGVNHTAGPNTNRMDAANLDQQALHTDNPSIIAIGLDSFDFC